jgi:phosphoribosyl 1,2-cyclic phosphodiesterase
MRFASLGSGSRGNATLVEGDCTRVLVDCGFAARETERRLEALGVGGAQLDAILVTHEHADHIRGVRALARRHGIEVWTTPGTWRQVPGVPISGVRLFSGHEPGFRIGDLRVLPFPVPHDAREPCQFVFESAGGRLGVLTDTGCVTQHIRDLLRECSALVLECNHDLAMLNNGPYPPSVRARVGGRHGHLSNLQAAELLDSLEHRRLRNILVGHVSEHNNRPELAREALLGVSRDLERRLTIAGQDGVGPWLEV